MLQKKYYYLNDVSNLTNTTIQKILDNEIVVNNNVLLLLQNYDFFATYPKLITSEHMRKIELLKTLRIIPIQISDEEYATYLIMKNSIIPYRKCGILPFNILIVICQQLFHK